MEEQLVGLEPEFFAEMLRQMIKVGASDDELDAIDDYVGLALAGQHHSNAAQCARLAVEILRDADRPRALAYALSTRVTAACMDGDVADVRVSLELLLQHAIAHQTRLAALSAAENVKRFLPGQATPDHVPHLLRIIQEMYRHFDLPEEEVSTLILAATIFSDYSAFQTAYRSLADAEKIARSVGRADLLLKVLGCMHSICVIEGDHAYAERVWRAIEGLLKPGESPPVHLVVNRATELMQTDRVGLARDMYESSLSLLDEDDAHRLPVLINLSACLRRLEDLDAADNRLSEARTLASAKEEVMSEQMIELELIAARNALHRERHSEVVSCLNRASALLDAEIQAVDKLHYRRGFRERYVERIEALLAKLPADGAAQDVVGVLAITRANQLTDWLHLLGWATDIRPLLSPEEADGLQDMVFRLANFGAPHLYGYREKYDDPMAHEYLPDPWKGFVEFASQLCIRYGFRRPFELATAKNAAAILLRRLEEGHGILLNLLTAGGKVILLIGNRYRIRDLPKAETSDFQRALYSNRAAGGSSRDLGRAISTYQKALSEYLADVLSELAADCCRGLIFMPDRMDLTPINLLTVRDDRIRSKMSVGAFSIRTCLALYARNSDTAPLSTWVGVLESGAGLEFAQREVERFLGSVASETTVLVDPEWDEFNRTMQGADGLLLSHHGMSVGIWQDPFTANMAGPSRSGVVSLDRVQGAAYRWPHGFVFLGACHSGGLVSRNAQGNFRSHEVAGFPTAFLVNGRCSVLGASWPIIDRFNFLFSALLAEEMPRHAIEYAVFVALAKLYEGDANRLLEILETSSDAGPEGGPATTLQSVDSLRRQPFCYGAYQLFTLL